MGLWIDIFLLSKYIKHPIDYTVGLDMNWNKNYMSCATKYGATRKELSELIYGNTGAVWLI